MTFTNAQLRDTMREVVMDFGKSYKVPPADGCKYGSWYSPDEIVPSCIVGHVIARIDVTLFGEIVKNENTTKIGVLADRYPGTFTSAQRFALISAQQVQDRFGTWGEALEEFEGALFV